MPEQPKSSVETLDLHRYFRQRAAIRETLTQEDYRMAKRLLDSIPAELDGWEKEYFYNLDQVVEWLNHLKSNTEGGSCNSDKIRNPKEYGFKSKADMKRKFELLKQAWKGIIDVEIDDSGSYVEMKWRLVDAKNTEALIVAEGAEKICASPDYDKGDLARFLHAKVGVQGLDEIDSLVKQSELITDEIRKRLEGISKDDFLAMLSSNPNSVELFKAIVADSVLTTDFGIKNDYLEAGKRRFCQKRGDEAFVKKCQEYTALVMGMVLSLQISFTTNGLARRGGDDNIVHFVDDVMHDFAQLGFPVVNKANLRAIVERLARERYVYMSSEETPVYDKASGKIRLETLPRWIKAQERSVSR